MNITRLIPCSLFAALLTGLLFVTGCASGPQLLPPTAMVAPQPRADNQGKYMCPYTSDGVVADWVDKGVKAKLGSSIGGTVGAYAGQQALQQVPFIGGFLGQKAGEKIGLEIAVAGCGGWDNIKKTSDLSFDSVEDLSVWLYVKYSTNEHYQDVLSAAEGIYPEMGERYMVALQAASTRG